MTIRPVHALCRSAAPYRIEVGGVLTAAGVRRGPHLLTVLASGSWEVRAGTSDAVRARFPESLVAPALYDAHVHLHPSVDLADYVAHGVTRVRDLGSRVGAGQELPTARDCADPLPDVVLGGPVLSGPGRPRLPIAAEWDHADDLPALVDAAARRGARWLKLYTRFPVELYPVAVDHAHAHGLRVTAHCRPGGYAAAVRAGVDELQHLATLVPGDVDGGTHAAHRRWAGRTADDDWPRLPAGTALCPTLLVHHRLLDEAERGFPFADHPPALARFWRGLPVAARPWSPDELTAARAAVAAMTAAVTELDGAGVRWVVGTDTPNPGLRAGASMWEEMNLLVAAGLDRSRVYRSAAVCPGVGERGDDSLVLLPLSTFDTESFPVAPPHAVLLRGCLFLTTRPSTEVTMPISYRRDPWLCIEWDEGDRVAVVNSRSRRRFRVQPDLLRMLNAMSQPTSPDHLELPGYSAEQLDDLLGRLRDAGLVQTVNGHDEVIASEWTASELAVHAQAARGGKPRVRKRDIPPARLRHQQVLATVELPESLPYSRPLAEVLRDRRSIRDFAAEPLTLRQLATFLDRAARVRGWLGPDVWQTTRRPSASGGGRHSLELYLVVRDVDGLEAGAYHYDPFDHVLHRLQPWGAELDALQRRLLCQPMTVDTPPPVGFYLASCYRRVQCKYGDMTLSVIYRDTGCLLQTLYLVATDLRLAPCATAAIETKPSPAFLAEHRDSLLHTANFALGVPAASEPTSVEFRPLTETGQ